MTNLEYLKRVKNISGLKEFLFGTECTNLEEKLQTRKTLALEIIAEELYIANKFKEEAKKAKQEQEIIIEKLREGAKKIKP